MRVLISVSARTYSREYVVLTNVFMRNSFFFFCIAYPFKDIMPLLKHSILQDIETEDAESLLLEMTGPKCRK